MNPINRNQLIEQLNWRYATKQFDPRHRIDPADWAALEQSLLLTPSSFGLQPWKFVVVTDPALREKLVPVSWGQRQIADASHLVVFAVKKQLGAQDIESFLDRIAEVRGVARESLSAYRDMMLGKIIQGMDAAARQIWATRQVYIALGNFLNSAALLGIDACPMEGIEKNQYDEILGLNKQGLSAVVVATAGYRAASDAYASLKKVRYPAQEVIVEI
jgi:nitroreductase